MTRPDPATKLAADVSTMFDEVSPRYDLINDVLTVGNDRLWRVATTKALAARKGMRVLDLAAGTGTSSAAIAKHGAHVVAADFSEGMLDEGRRRHADNERIEFVWADATQLPFEDDSFDAATISYGLRNVSDPKKALAEMHRVVKPGGRVVIAEFSTPTSALVRAPYNFYGRHVLPRVAGAINRDAAGAYRYLNESIESWPDQNELARWLREAGFERVAYRNLTFGIVALHRGFVPREVAKPALKEASQAKKVSPAKKATATTKPAAAKNAATAEKTAAAKKPAAAKESASTTSAAKKPAAAQNATAATKPVAAQKPAAAKRPAAAKKPATAKSAATAEKPTAAKKTTATKKPAAATPAAEKPAAAKPRSTTSTATKTDET